MYTLTPLNITGYYNLEVPHAFIRNASNKLAVMFPGRGYTCDMPLLYHLSRAIIEKGYDLLQVRYEYGNNNKFNLLPPSEQVKWMTKDNVNAVRAALEQGTYNEVLLVGKSMGSFAMTFVMNAMAFEQSLKSIWLTPTIKQAEVFEHMKTVQHPSYLIMGDNDPHYNAAKLEQLPQQQLIVPNANHSMEVVGNIQRSMEINQEIVTTLAAELI